MKRSECVHIRCASTPADAMAIATILFESFAEYRHLYTPRAFAATAIAGSEVQQRLSEGPVWLATTQTAPIGTVSAIRRRDEVYIRGMAVVPSARGRAVGWRLLEEVEKFATASGCTRMVLSTTPFLTQAIHLYARYGFMHATEGPHDLFGTPLFTMRKATYVNS